MQLRSLAYATDLAILGFSGRIEDRGDYLVAEQPDNPDYYWGNLLVMAAPPQAGDLQKWSQLFKAEFAHQPLVKHMTFGWDCTQGIEGDYTPFTQAGFALEKSIVLTLTPDMLTMPKHICSSLKIRNLESDDDWEQAIENQVSARSDGFSIDEYLPFKRAQMNNYRKMSAAGFGVWLGAFENGRIIGDCGIFAFGKTGRFQAVGTHPDHRKRGICGTLVYMASRMAFDNMGATKLVMVADPEYHAARIYESVGFKPTEKSIGLYRRPETLTG